MTDAQKAQQVFNKAFGDDTSGSNCGSHTSLDGMYGYAPPDTPKESTSSTEAAEAFRDFIKSTVGSAD